MTKIKIIKNLFAIGLLALLVHLVDFHQLWAALSQLTWNSLCGLALVAVILIYISALKWGYFLESLGSKISIMRLFALYMVGYFVNLVMPSYLGGDAVRSWYVGKKVGQHEALTATILERYTGIVAMVVLAFSFMWFVDLVTFQIKLAVFLVALGLVVITVLALSERTLALCDKIKPIRPILKHVHKIQEGFRLARKDRALLVKSFALSFLYHTFTVVNTLVAAWAVGWTNPPIWELFVVLPLVLLIGSIPVAPSGLGIQEGAFYYFLHSVGATPAQALGVGLVLRAKTYILALIGGLFWMIERARANEDSARIKS